MTWGDYIKQLGSDAFIKITATHYHGVSWRSRTVHWYTREWCEEWKSHFPISVCGKHLSECNGTHGFDLKVCPKCITKISSL